MQRNVGIKGIGIALPDEVRTNAWWPPEFRQRFEERSRRDVTTPEVFLGRAKSEAQRVQLEQMLETYNDPFRGSVERRIARPEALGSDLQIQAARGALADAGLDARELDVVLESSLPADLPTPANVARVIHELGARRAYGISFDAACSSFITGLTMAEALIRSGQARNVLVVHVGLISRLTDWSDPLSVNNGDGAGAVVVSAVDGEVGLIAHASRTVAELHDGMTIAPRDGSLWTEGTEPTRMFSRNLESGRSVVLGTADFAKETIEVALRRAGVEKDEITHFYSHQPSAFFNAAARLGTGLRRAVTTDTFRRYGSMHAANIPINLFHARQAGQLTAGALCVFYACGAGLNLTAAVYRWM